MGLWQNFMSDLYPPGKSQAMLTLCRFGRNAQGTARCMYSAPLESGGATTFNRCAGHYCELGLCRTGLGSELSINDITMPESDSGSTVFNFTVTLDDPPVFQSASVDYATADGTAAAGEDYEATSGWVTFDPGETEKYIPVTIFGDFICESHETFTVKLFNPVNATIAGGAVAQ